MYSYFNIHLNILIPWLKVIIFISIRFLEEKKKTLIFRHQSVSEDTILTSTESSKGDKQSQRVKHIVV